MGNLLGWSWTTIAHGQHRLNAPLLAATAFLAIRSMITKRANIDRPAPSVETLAISRIIGHLTAMDFRKLKPLLTRLGKFVPEKVIHNLNGILNYLYVGRWMSTRGYVPARRFSKREDLHKYLGSCHASDPVTYLEFGVYRGDSLRLWSQLLQHPSSQLHGFDSFEGLPESWVLSCDKGAFNVDGVMPTFSDTRVILHKGWFSDTVPPFLDGFRPAGLLVVHLDADLYSSTIFVLTRLKPYLTPSTVLVFDEFFDRNHELKALDEFLADTPTLRLNCIAATDDLAQVAFTIQ